MATVYKRGKKYYIQWYDHTGKRRSKSAKTSDKRAAERIANKIEADVALRRDGVIDPTLDEFGQQSKRSIESHLTDYKAKLETANRSTKHIKESTNVIRQICEFAGFNKVSDISADKVNLYAQKLQAENLSLRTIHKHLNTIMAFTKWLFNNHKLPFNPLSSLNPPNPKTDRRRERRMLLPDEWRRLAKVTINGSKRYNMQPWDRYLLYRTALNHVERFV